MDGLASSFGDVGLTRSRRGIVLRTPSLAQMRPVAVPLTVTTQAGGAVSRTNTVATVAAASASG